MKFKFYTLNAIKDSILTFFKWMLFASIIGTFVGIIGSLFHIGLDLATKFRMEHNYIILLLPAGGVIIALLYKLCRMDKDKGTNLILLSISGNEKLTVKTAPLIFISTIITHLLGGSAGREGAALQLGGSIAMLFSKLFRLNEKDKKIIIMCGMSAAFGALFGTPVTAAVFSMEIISVGVMYYSAFFPAMLASTIGCMVTKGFDITKTSFVLNGIPEITPESLLQIIALSVLCAGVSILFCISIHQSLKIYEKLFKNTILRAAVGGAMVVILSFAIFSFDYNGSGIDVILRALNGNALPQAFILKIIFTALTIGAGFKGGEIVPAFFVGATFGNVSGGLIGLDPSFSAGIGLVAVFCGATNCPISSLVLSIELFGVQGAVFFAVACAVSYMLSGYFGLYKEQKIIYSKLSPEFINIKTK